MGSVLQMRVVVYGLVVVIAGLVLVLRADGDSRAEPKPNGRPDSIFHGQTREKLLVAMTAMDGQADSAYMRWRTKCESAGPGPRTLTLRFGRQFGTRFTQRGRSFSFKGEPGARLPSERTPRYTVDFSGQFSADGRTIRGRGRVTHVELQDGRVVDTCRSKDVSWTAYRGMASR